MFERLAWQIGPPWATPARNVAINGKRSTRSLHYAHRPPHPGVCSCALEDIAMGRQNRARVVEMKTSVALRTGPVAVARKAGAVMAEYEI